MTSESLPGSVSLDLQPSNSSNESDAEAPLAKEPLHDLEQATPDANSEFMHSSTNVDTPVHQASGLPLPSPPQIPVEIEEPHTNVQAPSPNAVTLHQPLESTSSLQEIPLDPSPPPPLPKSPLDTPPHSSNENVPGQSVNSPLPQPPESARSVQTPPLRSASISSNTSMHHRSLTISQGNTLSVVLISSALDTIASSREAKRSTTLRDSTQRALEMIRAGQGGDRPRDIFEPLKLACETRNEKLMVASLDCISKLISHSFFMESAPTPQQYNSPPNSPGGGALLSDSLPDLVAHTITSAYTETTPDPVSLQIVKALLALVLSPTILVHHSSLLKAVRTVYNVFLLSQDPVNQMVAQGGLTQMVNHIFTRCKIGETRTSKMNGHSDSIDSSSPLKDTPKHLPSSERRSSMSTLTPENELSESLAPSQEDPNGAPVQSVTRGPELESDRVSDSDDTSTPLPNLAQIKTDVTYNNEVDGTPVVQGNEVREEVQENGKASPPKGTISL